VPGSTPSTGSESARGNGELVEPFFTQGILPPSWKLGEISPANRVGVADDEKKVEAGTTFRTGKFRVTVSQIGDRKA
jgi:hypothetical protein